MPKSNPFLNAAKRYFAGQLGQDVSLIGLMAFVHGRESDYYLLACANGQKEWIGVTRDNLNAWYLSPRQTERMLDDLAAGITSPVSAQTYWN